ncbi:hypothetical protein BWI15_35300 [Kribbella sp. ALI-6-A]|uniref:hypothetical protein n=1 Tax=Kribbella sp. ALI-6-A TaxID=1933817 RepID=UPI00097BBCBF|nr:hypothetical protein [Kribbella sp. ALI-6-A]ONI68287.1 hypothetical protein BWI15_35300 [Kribbella sp. ALI-6-A]
MPLRMTASIPDGPIRVTGAFLAIETRITNVGGSLLRLSTAWFGAELSVLSEGVVVRPPGYRPDMGRTITLEPGESFTYESSVNLGYPNEPSGQIYPLEPGTYQLYAVQSFKPMLEDGFSSEPAFEVHGGPWDVHIG